MSGSGSRLDRAGLALRLGGGDGAPPSEAALIARMVSLDTMESIEGCSMSASGLDVSADGPHAAGAIAPM